MYTAAVAVLLSASSAMAGHPAEGVPLSQSTPVEHPRREQRRIGLALAPDLYVLHAQKDADATVALLALRVTGSLTPRLSINASYGTTPNLLRAIDVGVAVALWAPWDRPLTPYAGITAGQLLLLADDSPDRTDTFALGVVGLTFLSRRGLDLSVEGGTGYQREERVEGHRSSVLVRAGVRLGYRFPSGW